MAHQRDVGPVEGGDDLEVALGLQHLLGKPRGGRVRDRVVRVHQVEVLAHRDLVLFHRQGHRVRGRLLEQGILGLRDFVEGHSLGEAPQPERARVGNDVHLVSPPRQLEAELSGDGPGAAIGGIARDADAHG